MRSNAARQYCRKVRRELAGLGYRNGIMPNVAKEVYAFTEENPQASYRELLIRFGEPAGYARETVAAMDSRLLCRKLRLGKRVMLAVAGALLAALVMWGGVIVYAFAEFSSESSGYSVISPWDTESID